MRKDLAGESVVEEGSVNGLIKTALELGDEMSGNLLLLWALSDSWCSFLGVGEPWSHPAPLQKSCCEEGFISQVPSPHAVLGLSYSHRFLCHQAGI